jgi:hypothetical protein
LSDVPGKIMAPDPAALDGITVISVCIRMTIIDELSGRFIPTNARVIAVVCCPVTAPGISYEEMAGIADGFLAHDKRFVILAIFFHHITLAQ